MTFLVQLDAFHGPLDLLMHLVQKQEIEPTELSLARLAEQYLEYVELLEQIDADAAGDFLETASSLLEIKSRSVLPSDEGERPLAEEPREQLVEKLLEFKRFRDKAQWLEQRAVGWNARRTRVAWRGQTRGATTGDQALVGVELWDLVSAFARVMRDRLPAKASPQKIVYDDTPVHVQMQRVNERLLAATGPLPFADLFPDGPVHKSTLVGVFLAILEMVRHCFARVQQVERFGEIRLEAGPEPLPPGYGELRPSGSAEPDDTRRVG